MRRGDLSALRPWRAEPEREGIDSPWCVTAPRRYIQQNRQLIACLMSEEDARTVAAAHEAMDLIQRILEGAALDEISAEAARIMRKFECFEPDKDDYMQQNRGE